MKIENITFKIIKIIKGFKMPFRKKNKINKKNVFIIICTLFFSNAVISNEADQFSFDQWNIVTKFNKLTDKTDIVATMSSIDKVKNQIGEVKPISMVFKCQRDKVSVIIQQHNYFGSIEPDVVIRLDSGAPKTNRWRLEEDNQTIISKNPIKFIRNLVNHQKMILGITPNSKDIIAIEFDLNGIDYVANAIAKNCKFSLH